ncbi:MAG: ABC transporter permease subunit [Clostridia bacterium]|nr:ABC transporter permease subunit [Clostridia bacterium]MBR3838133.1 ABC transporter permease subunit [Clostridia bacterium]
MLTIYKREMSSYFRSPIAYCIAGFFMVIVGLYFWIQNILSSSPLFSVTLSAIGMFLTFIIPIITMKLLADEKKNGTEVLLRTAPISMGQVVVGKYLAAFTVFLAMALLTTVFPIILLFLTEGGTNSAAGQDFGAYVGFILLGASYLAVTMFTSSFTESQTAAAVSGVVTLLVLYFMQSIGATLGGTFGGILKWFSPLARYSDFTVGSFNFASLIYYITFTMLFLYATVINLERKRWS